MSEPLAVREKALQRLVCLDESRTMPEYELHDPKRSKKWRDGNNHKGAANELRAAAHLMENGYEVFRALSPSNHCDLIATRDGKAHRVEVRTGQVYEPTGSVSCSRKGQYDILVIVAGDRIIVETDI